MVCLDLNAVTLLVGSFVKVALDSTADIEISRKPGEAIHGMYLDPHGRHLVISMESGYARA